MNKSDRTNERPALMRVFSFTAVGKPFVTTENKFFYIESYAYLYTVQPTKPKTMKAIKLILAVIEEIVFSGRQSREYKYTVKMTKGEKSYKVMIHIDRDSYDFQSSAVAYVWKDGDLEWSRVASVPYNEMKSLGKHRGGDGIPAFTADKNRLMTMVENILF